MATRSKSRLFTPEKRPMVEDDAAGSKHSKRLKKENLDSTTEENMPSGGGGNVEDSRKPFQRFWSEADEIKILEGMISFAGDNGGGCSDIKFFDFIEKSLDAVDFTRSRLRDKIRKLRLKYRKNAAKRMEVGDFLKDRDLQVYNLSQKLWGRDFPAAGRTTWSSSTSEEPLAPAQQLNGTAAAEKIELPKTPAVPSQCWIEFYKSVGLSGLDQDALRQGLELLEAGKRSELEEKWKKLQVAELELYFRGVSLIKVQKDLIFEAMKSLKD